MKNITIIAIIIQLICAWLFVMIMFWYGMPVYISGFLYSGIVLLNNVTNMYIH